jgi:ATP-dependent Clp protease ATP-binding subunit ClpB
VTQAGKDWLALTGFDPVYGARPLKRLVQTTIEDTLARKVLAGEIADGDTIAFDVNADQTGLVAAQAVPAG